LVLWCCWSPSFCSPFLPSSLPNIALCAMYQNGSAVTLAMCSVQPNNWQKWCFTSWLLFCHRCIY